MIYRYLIRPVLVQFSPETSMKASLNVLQFFRKIRLNFLLRLSHRKKVPSLSRTVFGIRFANPVGLAAGIDRNGEFYNTISDMGFGFVEIGSLTRDGQDGNPKPRIFRLRKDNALAADTGYPNKGVRHAIRNIQKDRPNCPIAANLVCRQGNLSEDEITQDYRDAFALMYDFADFFVINTVMSPSLEADMLEDVSVLSGVIDTVLDMRLCYDTYKPVLLKVSSDIPRESLKEIIDYARLSGIDGIVAASGTTSRDGLEHSRQRLEKTGPVRLSGAPLLNRNLETVRFISSYTGGNFPIIASGGIMSPEDAAAMLEAGASLVEVCTGLLYRGPKIVKKTLKHLKNQNKQ